MICHLFFLLIYCHLFFLAYILSSFFFAYELSSFFFAYELSSFFRFNMVWMNFHVPEEFLSFFRFNILNIMFNIVITKFMSRAQARSNPGRRHTERYPWPLCHGNGPLKCHLFFFRLWIVIFFFPLWIVIFFFALIWFGWISMFQMNFYLFFALIY